LLRVRYRAALTRDFSRLRGGSALVSSTILNVISGQSSVRQRSFMLRYLRGISSRTGGHLWRLSQE
jgi:hypothetical protein